MHLAQDTTQANGATKYGKNVVEGLKQEEKTEQAAIQRLTDEQDHVLKSFRLLIADLCQQFNGGHPGYVNQLVSDNKMLNYSKRCDWYGCDRSSTLEVCYAICPAHTHLLQPRSFRSVER